MNKELFEAAEIAKFNPKELGEYWESLKNFRDWYSVMSTQLKKGREEGLKEGLEKGLGQGRKEECFKNAKKMKQAGIAFDVIAQVTGLSIGEIASCKSFTAPVRPASRYKALSLPQFPKP